MFSNNVGLMDSFTGRLSRGSLKALAGILAAAAAVSACQKSSTDVLGPSGSKCAISLPAALQTIAAEGGSGSLQIAVAPECTWSVSSAADWLIITSSTSGQGTGVVEYVASANPRASERRGAVVVSERRVEVTQAAASCQLALTPSSVAVSAGGGEGVIAVTSTEGCEWSATSDADWLTVITQPSGSGSGSLRFRADVNSGPARSASLRVGNRTVSVQQHGTGAACAFAIPRTEIVVPATGGPDVIAVTGPANCPWSAQSHDSWILVTGGASGNGSGNVTLTIAPNLGAQRRGTATIAGNTYYVTQSAAVTVPCSYTLDSTSDTVAAVGETLQIGITSSPSCNWTASSHAPWITVLNGGGMGNGTARLAVAPNLGAARTNTATIAGQTYTITQQAVLQSCTYALDSTSASVGAAGGNVQFAVTAAPSCAWAATTTASWITVPSGTSNGNGTVQLTVASNAGPARVGTVMVADRTFTVSQAQAVVPVCTYTLSPTRQQVSLLGGSFSVQITTQPGCTWTAQPSDSWIDVTSSSAGTGSGLLQYHVGLALFSRSGEIEIAGQTLRVDQVALLVGQDGQ